LSKKAQKNGAINKHSTDLTAFVKKEVKENTSANIILEETSKHGYLPLIIRVTSGALISAPC
jgi:hypothetical protein